MRSIDRIIATFEGGKPDRIGIVDYYWGETVARWRAEGIGSESPEYYFDHDIVYFHFDPRFGFEEKLIRQDDEYTLYYSINGETIRVPADAGNLISKSDVTGYPIDFTIKGRAEWEQYKHIYKANEWRLYSNPPYSGSWFGYSDLESYRNKYRKAEENGKFKCLVFREPYECVRQIMGTDTVLMHMASDPDLITQMLEHSLNVTLKMITMLENLGMKMDGYWIWGDIAYNQGLFFSPRMYREILMPIHTQLFDALGKYTIYHTDGLIKEALPLLIEAGIKGINPIEVKAGNDFYAIVDDYGGDLVITGGIDARILSTNDRKLIDEEIRNKVSYAKNRKYIYHSDHSIPYDVSLDTYKFVIEKVREYGEYL